jgi:hypothetical protein
MQSRESYNTRAALRNRARTVLDDVNLLSLHGVAPCSTGDGLQKPGGARGTFENAMASTLSGGDQLDAALQAYADHRVAVVGAMAELGASFDAELYAYTNARARVLHRRILRESAAPFPYDPRRMRYIPTRQDGNQMRAVHGAAASRFRLYQRPAFTFGAFVKAGLCGRGPHDLCQGAAQTFLDPFEFHVEIHHTVFQTNVERCFRQSHAAQSFVAMVADSYGTLTERGTFQVTPLHAALCAVVDSMSPGVPWAIYRQLLPPKLRDSDAVRCAEVPPSITEEHLTLSELQCSPLPDFPGASPNDVGRFVRLYRDKFHKIVCRMVAVRSSNAKPDLPRETAIGVPREVAQFRVDRHFAEWSPVLGALSQPREANPSPMAEALRGAKSNVIQVDALADASELNLGAGVNASYFECFALLLTHSVELGTEAIRFAWMAKNEQRV